LLQHSQGRKAVVSKTLLVQFPVSYKGVGWQNGFALPGCQEKTTEIYA